MEKINKILAEIDSLDLMDKRKLISMLLSFPDGEILYNKIQTVVCNYYGLTSHEIQSKTRRADVVLARFVIMYLTRKLTKQSVTLIGRLAGGRDHATVLHACKRIQNLMEINQKIRKDIANLTRLIEEN